VFPTSWLYCPNSHSEEMAHSPFTFQIKTNTKGVGLECPLQIKLTCHKKCWTSPVPEKDVVQS